MPAIEQGARTGPCGGADDRPCSDPPDRLDRPAATERRRPGGRVGRIRPAQGARSVEPSAAMASAVYGGPFGLHPSRPRLAVPAGCGSRSSRRVTTSGSGVSPSGRPSPRDRVKIGSVEHRSERRPRSSAGQAKVGTRALPPGVPATAGEPSCQARYGPSNFWRLIGIGRSERPGVRRCGRLPSRVTHPGRLSIPVSNSGWYPDGSSIDGRVMSRSSARG